MERLRYESKSIQALNRSILQPLTHKRRACFRGKNLDRFVSFDRMRYIPRSLPPIVSAMSSAAMMTQSQYSLYSDRGNSKTKSSATGEKGATEDSGEGNHSVSNEPDK